MKKSVLLYLLCVLCLLIMHRHVMTDTSELNCYSYIYNLLNTFFDVSIIIILFIPFIHFNKKAIVLPIIIIDIISFVHIIYSNYFNSYLPFSLLGEFNNLNGLANNIFSAISPSIVYILIISILCLYIVLKYSFNSKHILNLSLVLLSISCILYICITSIEWKCDKNTIIFKTKNKYTVYRDTNYAKSVFELGIIQNLFCDFLQNTNNIEPNIEDIRIIDSYINASSIRPDTINNNNEYNIIMIIVESLISDPINKSINNTEITPNLNKLAQEGYYNSNMISEIEKGESSDGQFIYLTGLLPQKEGITIIDYFNNDFISFVNQIKNEKPQYTSRMIIPTSESFWRQKEMCYKYDIDSLFSAKDLPNKKGTWLNDEEIFSICKDKDISTKEPFISIILTASSHSPYDNSIYNSNITYPADYPLRYKNYLDAINYTDFQIGNYITHLRNQPWFDRTILLILSDHQVKNHLIDIENNKSDFNIPLILLNHPSEIRTNKDSIIYQTDIYPTILDIMNIKSKWRGVGNSIYSKDKNNTQKEYISSLILKNDYFKQ